MGKYLLSTYAAKGEASRGPSTPEEMQALFAVLPTPMVALNRAIAVAETDGPEVAIATIDAIAPDLETYHLMHAARGTMMRRLGRADEARAAFERATELAVTDTDRRFLARQIEELPRTDASQPIPNVR